MEMKYHSTVYDSIYTIDQIYYIIYILYDLYYIVFILKFKLMQIWCKSSKAMFIKIKCKALE
jgi:hypothetical protein